MILALKLLLTPCFIALVSLAGRRWGPGVNGWLIGLPLTSGPISLILALQNSPDFAARTAVGNLGGQASVCVFCLAYSLAARKTNWLVSAVTATVAFLLSTYIWNRFSLLLLPTFLMLLFVIALISAGIPRYSGSTNVFSAPWWDLPARMLVAATFVYLLTTLANVLGPQLSGLISPFPVFAVALTVFTHRQLGVDSAARLLRGYVIGSLGFAIFFMVVGGLLRDWRIAVTYSLAVIVAVGVNGLIMLWSRGTFIQGDATKAI